MLRVMSIRPGLLFGIVVAMVASASTALAQTEAAKPATPVAKAKKASIYDKAADVQAQVDKATAAAKQDNKRVLLMFGGDWCGWCHKLHELFASNAEIRKLLSDEYVLIMVETTAPNAEAWLAKCKDALSKEEFDKGIGFPFLGVLDADGKVITAQRTNSLEEGDHHDPGKVKDFLTHWTVTPQDAQAVLKEGLSRAQSEDKRVFVTFGAPWCGWCHRLGEWLAEPDVAAILNRDFVIVRVDVDRMAHGKAVLTQFRRGEAGGIPWFAILDAKGKPLGTSDGPGGNIGYPFKPEEIDHFMALVTGQGRRIEASQYDRLRQSLKEAADRIASKMKPRPAQ